MSSHPADAPPEGASDEAPARARDLPSRNVALVLAIIGSWGVAQLYLGQIRRAFVWLGASTALLVVGSFGMASLGARFGYGRIFAMLVVGMVLLWLGSIADVFLVDRARYQRRSILHVAAFWILGLVVGVGLRSAIRDRAIEAFVVPSGSMQPALLLGEQFLVDRARPTEVRRGEMIVFASPEKPEQAYVSRAVALPGDTIETRKGRLVLNGAEVPSCVLGKGTLPATDTGALTGEVRLERLDGVAYLVFVDEAAMQVDDVVGPVTAQPGEVLVLGDNRFNAHDSLRWFGGKGGGVPEANRRGRVLFRWYSPLAGGVAWDRFGVPANEPILPPSMQDLAPELARCLRETGATP